MDDKTTLTKDQQRKMLLSSTRAAYDKVILNSLKSGMARTEREDYLKEHWDVDGHDSAINVLNDFKVACTKTLYHISAKLSNLKSSSLSISISVTPLCWIKTHGLVLSK